MEIKLIPLATKKMKLRRISLKWVEETVQNPDQIVVGYHNRKVRQKIYLCKGKEYLLRVIGEENGNKFIVITAYLTSRIDKYWR